MARYGAYPIVWITGQEINAPETNVEVWKHVPEAIDRWAEYNHPHSGHQWVFRVSQNPLGGEEWPDWFALQRGHGGNPPQAKSYYKGY